MPTLHNPAENSLFCHRLERILGINERVEISDEEAADLSKSPIFVVEGYDAAENEDLDALTRDELNERASELGVEDPDKLGTKGDVIDAIREGAEDDEADDAADDAESSSAPKRTTAKRGGKQAEVTKAPDVETRG